MRKQIEFKDLKDGEFFECYGDVHLNYNTRKLCKCVKLDELTGREINGIIFNIRGVDTVFRLNDETENMITRIEDFPGVVILANEHGFISKETLNDTILKWLDDEVGIFSKEPFINSFTEWCNKQTNK
jgi:hypothetical protein